jgi:hypothetical protein
MSDRALWLEEWCPACRVAPGARCRVHYLWKTMAFTQLHVARGWRARSCPTCKALPGKLCQTPSGRKASRVHAARHRPGRYELLGNESVWQELEARGATIAHRPFQRPGWPWRAHRQDRAESIQSRRARRRRAVDRTPRALLRARGAYLEPVRILRQPAADRRLSAVSDGASRVDAGQPRPSHTARDCPRRPPAAPARSRTPPGHIQTDGGDHRGHQP